MMMFRNYDGKTALLMAAFLLTGTLGLSSPAFAQDRGFPGPPSGMGFPGPGGPGGPGRFGRGPRPVTIAGISANALALGLNLSVAQKAKVTAIQNQFQQNREKLRPRPVMGEQGPTQRDFERMRATGDKIRTLEQSVSQKITAVFTPAQKRAVPALVKEAETMRSVGLPLELSYGLTLSVSQKTKIAAIAQAARKKRDSGGNGVEFRFGGDDREKTHRQALAVLTSAQRKTVAAYLQSHPRMGFGGPPGGFRGGPGNGPPPL